MSEEQITKHLRKLEAAISVQAETQAALRTVVTRTLMLLHERGTLPLPTLIAALQSHAAFAQGAFRHPTSEALTAQIKQLQGFADAYEQGPPPSSASQA